MMCEFIVKRIKRGIDFVLQQIGLNVSIRRERPKWRGERIRVGYQEQYVNFDIRPGDRVLDVGSGGVPFPYATVLMDRFKTPKHRVESLVTNGKPLVIADMHELPFRDKDFDFVYSSHMMEFAKDPVRACREIMRVGKRGYIETPTLGKDTLFAWAGDFSTKWHVVGIGRNLCFFEYSERQLKGIGSSLWRDKIFSKWYEPLQTIFYENQDVFNVMFSWVNHFSVYVFCLNGSVSVWNPNAEVKSDTSPVVLETSSR